MVSYCNAIGGAISRQLMALRGRLMVSIGTLNQGGKLMNTQGLMKERHGKGIGFQVNVLVMIGVTLMVAILVSFIAYMSFSALVDAGKREKMLENKQIARSEERR